jgi:hypothetical protein
MSLHGKTKATLSVWNEKLDMKKEYLLIELLQRVTKHRLIKTCMTEKLKSNPKKGWIGESYDGRPSCTVWRGLKYQSI